MKHFIYLNPAVCSMYFAYETNPGRVPVSNNLLWTLFLGMGDEKLSLIKSALRGRTPLQALNDVVSTYMFEHSEDYHVKMHNSCAISLGYFFLHIGLSDLDTYVSNLLYIISYDN